MRTMRLLALAGALAIPPVALGHESGVHDRGTIKEITADHVVLAAKDGEQTFTLGAHTKILRGKSPARPEDVRVGERAVVHARRDGKTLRAIEIRLGTAGAASKPASKKEKKP